MEALGAYPRRKHLKSAPIGLALALPSNSTTCLERVSKDKRSSLLGLIISDEGNFFYNIETWITAASASGAPPLAAADDDEADDETDNQHDHPKPAKLRRGEADRVEEADLD